MKVVLLGKKDMAVGFSLAGLDEVYVPENDYQAKKRLEKWLGTPDIGVILLSEEIAEDIREDLQRKKEKKDDVYPLIVEIPDKEGAIEDKEDPLKDKIKRAVGIDITEKEN